MRRSLSAITTLCLTWVQSALLPALAAPPRTADQMINCEILVVGGGLAGAAAAYESLLAGKTVCLTEITDWVGGQISAQGTAALDERDTQRQLLFYPRGYLELRDRIQSYYGKTDPGDCWVSQTCFLPKDGHKLLWEILQDAAARGGGQLKWFPNTVIKELEISQAQTNNSYGGQQIQSAIAIQHNPAPNAPPLNTLPLSQTIEDAYRYENSPQFTKTILRFAPAAKTKQPASWYVIDATETGELIGLADVPYRLGIDARSHLEPSSSSAEGDSYCTQGFTYTLAMEATADPQPQQMPFFYPQYEPYYSYEAARFANFGLIFTYRRIWSPETGAATKFGGISFTEPTPGDISMQNWLWGNDYRPGTKEDNFIYTREQLEATGQLQPGGWMGGLRTDSLRKGEEIALGYYYWLVAGTTDSHLGDGVKKPYPNNRFVSGLDSPMGTAHGLSKYPYIREGRRIIGRPSWGYSDGFMVWEIDISRRDYNDKYYQQTLPPEMYRSLKIALAGLEMPAAVSRELPIEQVKRRTRSSIYPDSVGIGHYAIDFHPCMTQSPPERPGNKEREGERQGAGNAYPFQIPLRALIPQKIDNMLVAGKSIATSHIAAAAYRVHSFEWSSGAAAGTAAAFGLEKGVMPYQLVDNLPQKEPLLDALRQRLEANNNPIAFPNTSVFNESWNNWR